MEKLICQGWGILPASRSRFSAVTDPYPVRYTPRLIDIARLPFPDDFYSVLIWTMMLHFPIPHAFRTFPFCDHDPANAAIYFAPFFIPVSFDPFRTIRTTHNFLPLKPQQSTSSPLYFSIWNYKQMFVFLLYYSTIRTVCQVYKNIYAVSLLYN